MLNFIRCACVHENEDYMRTMLNVDKHACHCHHTETHSIQVYHIETTKQLETCVHMIETPIHLGRRRAISRDAPAR